MLETEIYSSGSKLALGVLRQPSYGWDSTQIGELLACPRSEP